jgi:hypothetical protein
LQFGGRARRAVDETVALDAARQRNTSAPEDCNGVMRGLAPLHAARLEA